MSNVVDTFYKGNINRFGLGGWNSVRDDFNEVSKSTQNVKLPFSNNINNEETSNIYKPQVKRYPQSSHFSPDLIRMQYFNDKIIDFENKMNNNYQANLRNAKYNVYEDQYDPLIGRRRNVQRRLEKIKNKLLNDEEQNRLMIQKKIEEENNIIDDLILENQKSPNENLNRIFNNNEDNNRDKNYDFDEVDQFLSGLLSKKHSPLILSRTSSKESTDLINEKYFSEEDSEDKLIPKKPIYDEEKTTQKTKRKSIIKRNTIKHKKRPKHTDIMKVLAQMDKYSVPKDSAKNELVEQSKQAGSVFNELYYGIKELKNDFKEKISKLNETTENNINDIKEILMLCENQNLKNAIEHIFDNRSRKPRKEKYYLDYEMKDFKAQIEKTIDEALDKYYKRKVQEAYDLNLKNEPIYNEKDYNLRIKENERSKYGLIHITNLYNQIQRMPEVRIKSNLLDAESAYSFSSSDTIKSNIFTFSNNSKNNFFPALRGLKEVNTCVISENEQKIDKKEKKEKKNEKNEQKNKKKKVQRDAFVTNLGNVEEEYDGHLDDKKKERKETIFEIKNESQIESDSKTIIYSDSFNDDELNKGMKTKSKKTKTKTEKKISKNEEKAKEEKEKEAKNNKSKSKKNNQNDKEEKIKSKNGKSESEKEKKESNNKSKNKSKSNKENLNVIKEENKESKENESLEDSEKSEESEESEESVESKEENN